jgi:hypothetical protein
MAQVIVREHAEEPPARSRAVRELEIDQRGFAGCGHQPVRFLREIVVRDAAAMEATQQTQRLAEVAWIVGACAVHRLAVDPLAREAMVLGTQQARNAGKALEFLQSMGFAPRKVPGERTQPPSRVGCVTNDDAVRCEDSSEEILLENDHRAARDVVTAALPTGCELPRAACSAG